MDQEKTASGDRQEPLQFYMNQDYAPSSPNPPSGLVHTSFYSNPITLRHGTLYSFNSDLSRTELQMWFRRFDALYEQNLSAILVNVPGKNTIHWNREMTMKSFLLNGSLIRNVIFCMKNGIVYCFPGSYYNVQSADKFIPQFIRRELRSSAQLVWSSPFQDTSKHVVITCWRSLSDDVGNIFGGIALNISYEALVRSIYEQAEKENHLAIYGIVDSEEQLIFTTNPDRDTHFRKGKGMPDLTTLAGQNSFRYPQLIRHIRLNPQVPQFDMRLDGKMYRVSWARIPYANWLLIQRVPVEKTAELDKLLTGK